VAAAFSIVLAVVAPAIAWLLTLGFPDDVSGRARGLATILVLFVAPQVILYTVASLGVAAQQARGRFALAAAAPAVENLALMATVVSAGIMWGTGLEVAEVPTAMVVWLGVGSTIAVAVHAVLQMAGAARVGVPVVPRLGGRAIPKAREAFRRLVRSVPVAVGPSASMFVLLACASAIPGGVIVVQMAYNVYYAATYLSGRAVSIAVLPALAEAAERHDEDAFAWRWRQGLGYLVMASAPLLVLLALLSGPLAGLLAQGELNGAAVTTELVACLALVGIAQLVNGVHDLGQQALFAHLQDRGPRLASMAALAVTLVVAGLALLVPVDEHRLVALVVAIPVGELAGAAVVLVAVRAAISPRRLVDWRPVTGTAGVAVAVAPLALGGAWLYGRLSPGPVGTAALLAGAGLVALAVYGGALRRLVLRPGSGR
ncbi:MAG TPA: lipid II flippase MurJ, partial [Pseudonocardia sp.]|nr:lipid II flippase MurJ [Pseudonocardia sp.]